MPSRTRRHRWIAWLAAIGTAVILAAVGIALAAAPPQQQNELQAALDELVTSGTATAALGRARHGEREWAASAGVEDLASGRPVDPDGHFRAGSVTKTFTAVLVLQLVDEGRLDLDDPISQHLPGLVPGGERISVRQLLNHTSGLVDARLKNPVSTTQDWLDAAFAGGAHAAPGTGWRYSNTNYMIAGRLVEKLTGTTYEQAVTDRLLRPLRLEGTRAPGTDPTIPEPHAHGYLGKRSANSGPQELTDVTEMDQSVTYASGELISTAADLNRFFAALLGGELVSEAALAAMRETVPTSSEARYQRYGLGLGVTQLSCGVELWGHSGGIQGFVTHVTRADDGRQITLSINPLGEVPAASLTALYETYYCGH